MKKAHWDFTLEEINDDEVAPFCMSCGKQEEWVSPEVRGDRKVYSKKNGEQLFINLCMNKNCQIGCKNNGGHFMEHSGFQSETCKRCGYTFTDPY